MPSAVAPSGWVAAKRWKAFDDASGPSGAGPGLGLLGRWLGRRLVLDPLLAVPDGGRAGAGTGLLADLAALGVLHRAPAGRAAHRRAGHEHPADAGHRLAADQATLVEQPRVLAVELLEGVVREHGRRRPGRRSGGRTRRRDRSRRPAAYELAGGDRLFVRRRARTRSMRWPKVASTTTVTVVVGVTPRGRRAQLRRAARGWAGFVLRSRCWIRRRRRERRSCRAVSQPVVCSAPGDRCHDGTRSTRTTRPSAQRLRRRRARPRRRGHRSPAAPHPQRVRERRHRRVRSRGAQRRPAPQRTSTGRASTSSATSPRRGGPASSRASRERTRRRRRCCSWATPTSCP